MPVPTSGIWGNTSYPDWFNALVAEHGFTPEQAESFFGQWLATDPHGPDGQPLDLGPEWNQRRDSLVAQASGYQPPQDPGPLGAGANDQGDPRSGGGGPDLNRTGGGGGDRSGGGQSPMTLHDGRTVQPMPTSPPPSATGPGRWKPRIDMNRNRVWVWVNDPEPAVASPVVPGQPDQPADVNTGGHPGPGGGPTVAPNGPVDPYTMQAKQSQSGGNQTQNHGNRLFNSQNMDAYLPNVRTQNPRIRQAAAPAGSPGGPLGSVGRGAASQTAQTGTTPPKRTNNGLGDAYL